VNSFRRYFGVVSIAILLVVAVFAYLGLQGTSAPPPAILDPDFSLWRQSGNMTEPIVWSMETNAVPSRLVVGGVIFRGRNALLLGLYENATTQPNTFVSLSETLDGVRLTHLLNSTVGLWVFKEACNCDSNPLRDRSQFLAVQVDDGIREVSFLFTDNLTGSVTFLGHRIEFIPTPSNQWSYEQVSIGEEYKAANWSSPTALTFSLFFEVGNGSPGWHRAYISHMATTIAAQLSSAHASGQLIPFEVGDMYQTFKVQENLAMIE
jgi:hypothetical protein